MDYIAITIARSSDPIFFIRIAVAVILAGAAAIGVVKRLALKRAAANWPIAPATVEMYYTIDAGSRYWTPVLGYHYEVNGESYSGSVSLNGYTSKDHTIAEESGRAWVNRKIVIRYNPSKPEKSAYLEADGAPRGSVSYGDDSPSTPSGVGDLFNS